MLIDDFSDSDLTSKLGTTWRGFSDRVMGGVSQASVTREQLDGRWAMRLRGDVRLENNGGFVQAALDLSPDRGMYDASGFTGLRLTVRGNGEEYGLHLRSADNTRPWQSYRAQFVAGPEWETLELPFASFTPHRLEAPLVTSRLRRIGLVAIGRAFTADLAVSEIAFYR
ncbi:CIA30 family protein [Denitrobaculum tricleocarpae]|uniref:CIA30 family protein n=1 Tax=Denitrobaculum tricleocarpae TaxID=2591009 RepID=A0A545T082_9PROT|nr:CIA30 family protein [Denitrobaculum tricleocarpae]TQV70627.1 CIA30 family protein [Denitrobaculum tricleocarpae]